MDVDLADLAAHASEAEALLKGLSNSNRLMVLCALSDGELSVTELNERIPLSQSALSQHLATLRKAGMVATRRESQTIYYRLDDPKVSIIIEALHGMFCGALA
ncbi:MAG: helix-turn-helix transcriptional regulator [Gammaproteobacteria bacterium]|nr:helix-turn-helix transcriptional regulator [Gammaproteobacteria bacterium]MBQ0839593.1 helix-turn-helix transcriptional regulator [Gammaproteobacteria bacterium]